MYTTRNPTHNRQSHDGQAYSFYKNAQGQISFPSSIHPGPRDRTTKIRKKQNSIANHQQRRETNQRRSQSPLNNPTWHGIGRHANLPHGH